MKLSICQLNSKKMARYSLYPQIGKPSYFPRRTKLDQKISMDQTISQIFNQIRVADNQKYPLYFEHQEFEYVINVYKRKKRIKLLIRADAKPSIGTGDLISCLYLSEWLEDYDFECILLTKSTQTAREILKESDYLIRIQWLDPQMTIESEIFMTNFISDHHVDGLLMEITERSLHDYRNCFSGIWLGTINFDYQIPNEFNFIWNWQVNVLKKLKDHSAKDKILGPDSVLIKRSIWDSKWHQSQQNKLRVLVTMGGADQHNFTQRIYNDLKLCFANLHLVLGSGYYHSESIENYSKDLDFKSKLQFTLNLG